MTGPLIRTSHDIGEVTRLRDLCRMCLQFAFEALKRRDFEETRNHLCNALRHANRSASADLKARIMRALNQLRAAEAHHRQGAVHASLRASVAAKAGAA